MHEQENSSDSEIAIRRDTIQQAAPISESISFKKQSKKHVDNMSESTIDESEITLNSKRADDAYSDSKMDSLMSEVAMKNKIKDQSENRSEKNALNGPKSVNRQQAYYDKLSSVSVAYSGKTSELSIHEAENTEDKSSSIIRSVQQKKRDASESSDIDIKFNIDRNANQSESKSLFARDQESSSNVSESELDSLHSEVFIGYQKSRDLYTKEEAKLRNEPDSITESQQINDELDSSLVTASDVSRAESRYEQSNSLSSSSSAPRMRVVKDQVSDGSKMTNLSSQANKESRYESTLNSKLASSSDEISILDSLVSENSPARRRKAGKSEQIANCKPSNQPNSLHSEQSQISELESHSITVTSQSESISKHEQADEISDDESDRVNPICRAGRQSSQSSSINVNSQRNGKSQISDEDTVSFTLNSARFDSSNDSIMLAEEESLNLTKIMNSLTSILSAGNSRMLMSH